jgi:hypothetical protein
MPQSFRTDRWQVQLPEGWIAQLNAPGMVTLYSPSGVGTLRVTFSDAVYDGAGVGQDFRGKLVGKYYAGTHRGTFRRSWHLSCLGRELMVRYSCAEPNANVEVEQVDEILQNLDEIDDTAA